MPEFEIWEEGYAATGEHATASFIGKASGETFDEACINFAYPEDKKDWNGKVFIHKGDHLNLDKNPDGTYRRGSVRGPIPPGVGRTEAILKGGNYSSWGCQYFDNEAEARKSFG